ncbi:MAG: hypothetical protein K5769_07010 [Pseudobutyrivibrio sp.]|nr:hypothetical protein [Pseudobutyrivibrio sp.]
MDVSTMNTYLQSQYADASKVAADKTTKSIGNISKESSREEITEAVKSFETYMMEQVLKQTKESFVPKNEEDSSMSMYKDYFMDAAYTKVASQMVDQVGGQITEQFVDQIMRNYGITANSNPPTENLGLDAATVSDDIATTNASTVTEVQA